jgi:putative Holliday junction resolvase
MKLLGIDYGLRRIGLAISEGAIASPLGIAKNLPGVVQIAKSQGIDKLVIGLPDPRSEKIKKFGTRLSEITELPVEYWDETLSTVVARKKMIDSGSSTKEKKQSIDQNAAAVILQSYLDAQHPSMPI